MISLNIQNLKNYISINGNVIKNYNELCDILQIKPTNGKSKSLQIKRFNDYVSFTKQGHKFIIDEILDKPIPPIISDRGSYTSNNAIILCDYLVKYNQNNNGSKNSIITNFIELSYLLGFVNYNYRLYNHNYKLLNDMFDLATVIDFFRYSKPSWLNHITSTLNLLQSQFIIDWHKCYNVKTVDNHIFNTQELPPLERDLVIKQILQAKQDALNILSSKVSEQKNISISFKSVGTIFNFKDRELFYSLFDEQLHNYGYSNVYNAIIIYFSSDRIELNRDSLISQSISDLTLQTNQQFFNEQLLNKSNRINNFFINKYPQLFLDDINNISINNNINNNQNCNIDLPMITFNDANTISDNTDDNIDDNWGAPDPFLLHNINHIKHQQLDDYKKILDFLVNINLNSNNSDSINVQEPFSDDFS